jgi:microcystin degradation protein MlrC
MLNIALAECIHEISSFNPVPTRYDDFLVSVGDEILERHRSATYEVAGVMDVLSRRSDVRIVPTYSVRGMTSGGPVADADFERIAAEWTSAIRAAGPVDGACFVMHGAMGAVSEPDCTGYLIREARRILGERIPIVVSLDLHGILTRRILEQADAIVPYHTYPHVDFFSTGQRAARLLLRILVGKAAPVSARVTIPALVRGDELITATGSFGLCTRTAEQLEAAPPGLSAGLFIGNPFTDVPELQTYSVIVADGDAGWACREAERLASLFWQHHEKMQVPLTTLAEAVRIAKSERGGTIALTDAADATSSGASGDSNAIVRALTEAGYEGRVLAPVVDAPAVEAAFAAGIGATLKTTIGGQLDPARFTPLPVTATVRLLSDGRFVNESHGSTWNGGRTAVLEAGNLTLVVTSRPVHLYDRSLFLAHGQDPRRFDAVVVKSPHCQPHMYAEWCRRVVNVDAPGSTSANVRGLGHTQCPRPIFPLDRDVGFTPRAEVFRRSGS